jgi:Uma2 family endonuclease
MREIELPPARPALEWAGGRISQKVSPQRRHALAQARFAAALGAWAQERGSGMVGTEWEFNLAAHGEIRRPLVPDVAYLLYRQVPSNRVDDADFPCVAPNAVIEVLAPCDRALEIEEKVRVYLASGTSVVFLVDPEAQTVTIRDGSMPVMFDRDHDVSHHSLHGFTMPACQLFDAPRPLR